ncbi:MAG: Holliday junction branch migration protein RuvA, partial [Lentisphaeria bacterium]
ECDLTQAVVDVNGVGYAILIPMSTYDKLPRVGGDVQLLCHLYVREDALQLFGFADATERRLFRLLITVSGVGCRLALNVLSCMSVESFCRTVMDGDIKQLTRVNGLGKRSAERLVVELREKVAEIEPRAAYPATGGGEAKIASREAQDAVAALETLGFKTEKARRTVQKICTDAGDSELKADDLIRKALKALNS